MSKTAPALAFAKNRIEELGFDLWNDFVVPLYFDKLSLDEVRKPLVFEGGRGCGKTTLLRYLSHATQLSPRRHLTQENLPRQIGLYLRADTRYLRTFQGETLTAPQWQRAYEHDLCLSIVEELLSALKALSLPDRRAEFSEMQSLTLEAFGDFDSSAPQDIEGLHAWVKKKRNQLSMWLNNPDELPRPLFFPLKQVLLALIGNIRGQISYLQGITFFVFVDEYENLLDYQMRVINTYLKHSEDPVIFHIATKRHGMATKDTVGTEPLQQRDDYRTFDVEAESEADFELFAAELFCFRLRKKDFRIGPSSINEVLLCSPDQLSTRRNDAAYRRETIEAVKKVLPEVKGEDAARFVLQDKSLHKKLFDNLREILSQADATLKPEQFINESAPIESICTTALLYQGKAPKTVLEELEKVIAGKPSKFKTADWAHTYFAGCMYQLFLPLQRPCILYAGFDSFLRLSKGNARHFLELCHLSMLDVPLPSTEDLNPIAPERQAYAARSASALFLKETQGSGEYGNRLFHVANTLGQIFRLSHARPSQSEAERTHFAISKGELAVLSSKILAECVKWSVLFEARETKVKGGRLTSSDYILNPIYAPYFGISYNKGRKLEIAAKEGDDLLSGSRDDMNRIVKGYQKAWHLSEQDQMHLFGSESK